MFLLLILLLLLFSCACYYVSYKLSNQTCITQVTATRALKLMEQISIKWENLTYTTTITIDALIADALKSNGR